MRIIKFRGKVKYNGNHKFSGDWIYGYYRSNENGNAFITETLDEMDNYIFDETEIDENTVGQFTGLHDKNGKEIYEGDIVSNGIEKCIIVWVERYAGFMLKLIGNDTEAEWTNPIIDITADDEVIGNIWEDSDLLNDSKNTETN